MYGPHRDRNCYAGSSDLKNKPGFLDQTKLDLFETAITAQRANEPLPQGSLTTSHYRAIHRHLFQDVYRWAGRYRDVRISKGGNAFCYPEHVRPQMTLLFSALKAQNGFRVRERAAFVQAAAHFLGELNAIHPFPDGNGRLLADRAGHPLKLRRLQREPFMRAVIASFSGDESALAAEIDKLTA